jgi:predicted AAA+ superfamily ATPase
MLAHGQGSVLNAANLARGLAVDGKTVARYLDLMVDLMLVRRLRPFAANVSKRLVRSPKVFVRDCGLVHALLGIPDRDTLLGHPVVGGSWEGFVIEHLAAVAPERAVPYFYRTATGAEIDLLLDIPGEGLWAIDITRGRTAVPEKGFHIACADLQPARRFVVNAGADRYSVGDGIEAIGVVELAGMLSAL